MIKKLILLTVCLLALSSCLMPQNFVAEIKVRQDQSIEIHYEGQLLHVMAHSAYDEESKPNEVDDQRLRKEAFRIFNLKEFRKSKYIGRGAFEVDAIEKVNFNEESSILPMLDVGSNREGVFHIGVKKLSEIQRKMILDHNVQIQGKIRILLPKNAKVISHNANFGPWFFSDYYVWKIKNISDSPLIKFNLF